VKAVNDLPYHTFDTDFSKKGSLVSVAVANRVKLERLRLFITRIKLELNVISSRVHMHLARGICNVALNQCRLSLN